MCVLSIKVPIQKKSGNLFNDPHMFFYQTFCVPCDFLWSASQHLFNKNKNIELKNNENIKLEYEA